ncbi:MBL fold metallo-hydrolase [Aquihabitans sp. G128]|uniref:MBL fold metallo-hydrolase n=1 Tax=Aquihabitans sp. G128 TaxID=2849779 RepID=UPI001C23E0C1|nr:MBL fold metallo-hydrolase [Aquihabitans sp. G128]QXC62765.1 MBL fold metallo-hydrolase [Aquihabitans sp. G128]
MAPDLRRHLTKDRPALSVTVLGSAGTAPHADNPCSGYLVRTPSTTVWVDTGPGTYAALQEHVALADVDAIVVTHEHPDHWSDLAVVRNAARYLLHLDQVSVLGTAGTHALLATVLGGSTDPLRWTTVTDGAEATVGDVSLRFSRTDHPVETLAVRAEAGGRVLAYSADTGPAWSFASLDPAGTGFDLALCEATLDPHEAGSVQHLTAAQAGAMADASKVQRLALTHLVEGSASRREEEAAAADAFDGPVEIARPGYTFTV